MWDFAGNFTTQLDTINAVSTERKYQVGTFLTTLLDRRIVRDERVRRSRSSQPQVLDSVQCWYWSHREIRLSFHICVPALPSSLHSSWVEIHSNIHQHKLSIAAQLAITLTLMRHTIGLTTMGGYWIATSEDTTVDMRSPLRTSQRTQHRRSESLHRKICIGRQAARFINNNTTATGLKWSWNAYSRKVNLWVWDKKCMKFTQTHWSAALCAHWWHCGDAK